MEFVTRDLTRWSSVTARKVSVIDVDYPPNFCGACGAEVWPLKGTDVLTCKRGHHQPNVWTDDA